MIPGHLDLTSWMTSFIPKFEYHCIRHKVLIEDSQFNLLREFVLVNIHTLSPPPSSFLHNAQQNTIIIYTTSHSTSFLDTILMSLSTAFTSCDTFIYATSSVKLVCLGCINKVKLVCLGCINKVKLVCLGCINKGKDWVRCET